MDFHSPASLYTKFDENPPYTRQNSEEAFIYEQAAFANISDYEYRIEELEDRPGRQRRHRDLLSHFHRGLRE